MNTKQENRNSSKRQIKYRWRSLCYSFKYAIRGIARVLKAEKSFRMQLLLGTLTVIVGFLFRISPTEWLFVILMICIILCLEMINTAFELIIDLVTEEYKIIVEHIKDIAAGAVLIASFTALIIGLVIFIPYFIALFQ